jgi:hypothetical protein
MPVLLEMSGIKVMIMIRLQTLFPLHGTIFRMYSLYNYFFRERERDVCERLLVSFTASGGGMWV